MKTNWGGGKGYDGCGTTFQPRPNEFPQYRRP